MERRYRKNSGIVLLNTNKLVFAGKRSDIFPPLAGWQMPQGGLDFKESYKEAAARELSEEVGTKKFEIIAETEKIYQYDFPEISHFGKSVVGQKQKWFLAKFLGDNTDININHEFSEWKWLSTEQLLDLIVDFKKEIYRQVFEEFKNFFI